MPITAPEGAISLPEDYLAETIAACARWQTMTDTDNAEAAKASIYFDSLTPPTDDKSYTLEQLDELRPFVILFSDEETGVSFTHSSHSTSFNFVGSGKLKGIIELSVDPAIAHDGQEVFRRAKNDVGVLLRQMLAFAGQAGYLAIRTISLQGPLRTHPDDVHDEGDYVQYRFTIDWGK